MLEMIGQDLLLKKPTYTEDPIYGQGTVSYTESTIRGKMDFTEVQEGIYDPGSLLIGEGRVFVESTTNLEKGDIIDYDGTSYEVRLVREVPYEDSIVIKIGELVKYE